MNDFAHDELASRLAGLEPRVDAELLVRRVLSRSSVRHHRRSRRVALAALAAPIVLVIAAALTSYFAPAFAEAVADAPVGGGVTGWMLRGVGLAGVPHRISSFGDSATSSGYAVELVGGYADSGRTILLARVEPASRIAPGVALGQEVSLRDQFGQSYRLTGETANTATGENVMEFEPLRWPASVVGARLRLVFDTLERGPALGTQVRGRWELAGVLATDEVRDLRLPADGDIGPMHIAFMSVRTTASALLVDMRIVPDGLDLQRIVPDGSKGRPAFMLRLRDDAGSERMMLQGGSGSSGGSVTARWIWFVERSGTYVLEISYEGVGTLSRTIDVP